MNVLFKNELIEGLTIWMLCWKSTPTAQQRLLLAAFLLSAYFHRVSVTPPVSVTHFPIFRGVAIQKPQLKNSWFHSVYVFQHFGGEPSPFIDRPPFVQVVNTASSSLLEWGMNGSIILGADSSDGARGCPWTLFSELEVIAARPDKKLSCCQGPQLQLVLCH